MAGEERSRALEEAINYATSNGVLVIAGMGNKNSSTPYYPAAFAETLAVGSTDPDDSRSTFFNGVGGSANGSNYGSHIDLVAPGNYIFTLSSNEDAGVMRAGTSMAVPVVAGIASLLLAQDRSRSLDDLRWILYHSSADLVGNPAEDRPGWDKFHGFGRVDAHAALTFDQPVRLPENALHIFPNPAQDHVYVYSVLPESSRVEVTLFGSMGDAILTTASQDLRVVNYEIEVGTLPVGLYFVQLKTASRTMVKKLLITR